MSRYLITDPFNDKHDKSFENEILFEIDLLLLGISCWLE